jgi:hypothetical protein
MPQMPQNRYPRAVQTLGRCSLYGRRASADETAGARRRLPDPASEDGRVSEESAFCRRAWPYGALPGPLSPSHAPAMP